MCLPSPRKYTLKSFVDVFPSDLLIHTGVSSSKLNTNTCNKQQCLQKLSSPSSPSLTSKASSSSLPAIAEESEDEIKSLPVEEPVIPARRKSLKPLWMNLETIVDE